MTSSPSDTDLICPKCGGRKVPGNVVGQLVGFVPSKNYVRRGPFAMPMPLTAYACTQCGFMEVYVANPQDLRSHDGG